VDEDTRAFNAIIAAFRMPGGTPEEKKLRDSAIEKATVNAIRVPFEVMNTAFLGYEVAEAMVRDGNPSSVTDAGVGAIALHAAIQGSWLNVQINAAGVKHLQEVREILASGAKLLERSLEMKQRIMDLLKLEE